MNYHQVEWYYKAGGNVDKYYNRCLQDKLKCPMVILECLWRELIYDAVEYVITTYNLEFVLICSIIYVAIFGLLLLPKFIRPNYQCKSSPESESFEQFQTQFEVLKYNIDMGHNYFLENVCARITNATNEFTYMRRCVMKFIGVDRTYRLFAFLDDAETKFDNLPLHSQNYTCLRKIKYKLSFSEISMSTSVHVKRIDECFAQIGDALDALKAAAEARGWCARLVRRVIAALRAICRREDAGAPVRRLVGELHTYIQRTIDLVDDKHSSLMNNTHANIRRNLNVMEDSDVPLSEKLDVVLATLGDWLSMLAVRYIRDGRYSDIKLCMAAMPAVRKLERRLQGERCAIELLKKLVGDTEGQRSSARRITHKVVRGAYTKAIETIYDGNDNDAPPLFGFGSGQRSKRRSPDLHKFVCTKNIVHKTRSHSPQSLLGGTRTQQDLEAERRERKRREICRHYHVYEYMSTKLLLDGEQKQVALRALLTGVENLTGEGGARVLQERNSRHKRTSLYPDAASMPGFLRNWDERDSPSSETNSSAAAAIDSDSSSDSGDSSVFEFDEDLEIAELRTTTAGEEEEHLPRTSCTDNTVHEQDEIELDDQQEQEQEQRQLRAQQEQEQRQLRAQQEQEQRHEQERERALELARGLTPQMVQKLAYKLAEELTPEMMQELIPELEQEQEIELETDEHVTE